MVGVNTCLKFNTICYLIALIAVINLAACKKVAPIVVPAFYHWQTELSIDSTESVYLNHLSINRLYTKYFDVSWDQTKGEPKPTAVLQYNPADKTLDSLDIIPCIFITNQVFEHCTADQIKELSDRIWMKVQLISPDIDFKEIQFDCDWTLRTRDAYFKFLSTFRTNIPNTIQLSATIRLHQYRYPKKTGIPPVDRGMLMFYNMGDLQDWNEPNSILNIEKATPYLQNKDYSLPLDIALPLFHWGVLFREGKMIKLINGLNNKRLSDTSFLETSALIHTNGSANQYRVKKSTYLDGYYLYKGDEIRLESVSTEQLKRSAKLLQPILLSDTVYLSFYHLDTPFLEAYHYDVLQECLDILSDTPN